MAPIKEALCTKILPAILGLDAPINNDLCHLLSLGIKPGGLAIWYPTSIVDSLFCTSQQAILHLAGSLPHNEPINTHNHLSTIQADSGTDCKEQCNDKDVFLQALLEQSLPNVKKCFEWAGATGASLTTIPDHLSGTELI